MVFRTLVETIIRHQKDPDNTLLANSIDALKKAISQDLRQAYAIGDSLLRSHPVLFRESPSYLSFLLKICDAPPESGKSELEPRKLEPGKSELEPRKFEPGKSDAELKRCKNELERCKNELEKCKDELEKCKDELEKCKDEFEKWKDVSDKKITNLTRDRDYYKEQFNSCVVLCQNEIDHLHMSIDEYDRKLNKSDEDISLLLRHLKDCFKKIDEKNNKMLEFENGKQDIETCIGIGKDAVSCEVKQGFKKMVIDLTRERDYYKREFDSSEDSHKSKMKNLHETIDEYNGKLEKSNAAVLELSQQLNDYLKKLEEKHAELEEVKNKLAQATQDNEMRLQNLKNEERRADLESVRLKKEIKDLKQSNNVNSEKKVIDLIRERDYYKKELGLCCELCNSEIESLHMSIDEYDRKLQQCEQDVFELFQQVQDCSKKLEEKNEQLKKLEEKNEQLNEYNLAKESKINLKNKELDAANEAILLENIQLRKDIQNLKRQQKTEIEIMKDYLQAKEIENVKLEDKYLKTKRNFENMRMEYTNDLRETKDILNAEMDKNEKLDEKVKNLYSNVQTLETENLELRTTIKNSEQTYEIELEKERKLFQDVINIKNEELRKFENELKQEAEKQELYTSNEYEAALNSHLENYVALEKELRDQNAYLTDKVAESDLALQQLMEAYKTLHDDFQVENEKINVQLEKLQDHIHWVQLTKDNFYEVIKKVLDDCSFSELYNYSQLEYLNLDQEYGTRRKKRRKRSEEQT